MKRMLILVVAALIVFLAYPSTNLMAGPDKGALTDPSVITKPDVDDPVGTGDDDGDDGDADGLSGYGFKHGGHTQLGPGGSSVSNGSSGQWVLLRQWWNWLIWIR